MLLIADVVEEQLRRPVVVRDDDVGVAVVVDVSEGRAAADRGAPEHRAGARWHVIEASVREVSKQLLRLVQRKRIVRLRQRLNRLHGAVDGEQIEPAVVVVVEPRRAEARERQAGGRKTRPRAGILETAFAVAYIKVMP